MLNLDEISTFEVVANSGSFTAAAGKLHVTQSTISHQIKRLEERLGQKLFVRTTRSVKLTLAGEPFLSHCSKLLQLAAEAEQSISVENIVGEVHIGVSEEFANEKLHELLNKFRIYYPDIVLHVEIGLGAHLSEQFNAGVLDLILTKQVPASDECLQSEPLTWAGNGDLLTLGSIPLAFLPNPCSFRRAAINALEQSKQDYSVILVSNSLQALRGLVMAKTAVSVLPESLCPPELVLDSKKYDLPALPDMGYKIEVRPNPDKPLTIVTDIVHKLLVQ